MTNSPMSRVRLFNNVPFDLNYDHTRWFNSVSEQNSYFNSLTPIVKNVSNLLYVRPERGEVKLHGTQEELFGVNYIEFMNSTTGKKFYGFVTNILYGNSNMVKIEFEIDVIQTHMFDMEFKQSFIEREHCKRWNSDGTPVVNTVPENLDLGTEYVTISKRETTRQPIILLISTTEPLDDDPLSTNHNVMSGTPNSLFYYIFVVGYSPDYSGLYTTVVNGDTTENKFHVVMEHLQNEQNVNKVVSLNFLPFLPFSNFVSYNDQNRTVDVESDHLLVSTHMHYSRVLNNKIDSRTLFQINNVFNEFKTPNSITESKLLFYPYSFGMLLDNAGNTFTIKPEYLDGNAIRVNGRGTIDSKPKFVYSIQNYKGENSGDTLDTFENGIINPITSDVPVVNDYTATYLQGNKNSLVTGAGLGVVSGIASTALGTALLTTGNVVAGGAMIVGGLSSFGGTIAKNVAKYNDIQSVPDNLAKQGGTSSFNIGVGKYLPMLVLKQISVERIRIIEDYFKMYGYAVNRVKTPNIRTRQRFNYVKTVGANITGKIPKDNLSTIKNVFDKGVTLWHTNDMFNFTSPNNER